MSAKENNNWGRWGDDDERGALNLLTPEVVMRGAAAITTGKVYPSASRSRPRACRSSTTAARRCGSR